MEEKCMYKSKYDPKAPLTGSTFGLHGTTVTNGKGINELKKVREFINNLDDSIYKLRFIVLIVDYSHSRCCNDKN